MSFGHIHMVDRFRQDALTACGLPRNQRQYGHTARDVKYVQLTCVTRMAEMDEVTCPGCQRAVEAYWLVQAMEHAFSDRRRRPRAEMIEKFERTREALA